MTITWHPGSWNDCPAGQQPSWPEADFYNETLHELGTKPAELTQEYDAPNVWSAVGNLAEIVAGMNTKPVKVLSEI